MTIRKIKFEYKDNFSLLSITAAMSVILFAGIFGIIEGICSAYGINYDRKSVLMTAAAACVICSGFSAMFFINPIVKAAVYTGGFIEIGFIISKIKDVIKEAALAAANQGYHVIRDKYKLPDVEGFEQLMPAEFTINAVLILFAVFLALFFAVCLFEIKISVLPAVIVLLVYAAAVYFDSSPSVLSVFCMTAFIVLGGIASHNGAKLGILVNMFLAAVLILSIALGKNLYSYSPVKLPSEAHVMKQAADVYLRDLMIKKFAEYKKYRVSAKISSGVLSAYSGVSMSDETALTVEMEKYTDKPVFIKAFTGTIYKDSQWKEYGGADMTKESISLTAQAMKEYYEPKKMKLVSTSDKYVYLPYYSDLTNNTNIDVISDDKVTMTGKQPEIEFYPYDEAYVDDDEYYEEVKNKYLQMPEVNAQTIQNLCSELNLTNDIEDIKNKLSAYFEDFTFTRNPGLVPWKTDFINYFINESRKGHTAHFATTAVLVYRNMGIPARYAEGYVFEADESGTTSIPEKNAYAWTEVYVKNFGWIPVDVTPEKTIEENYEGVFSGEEEISENVSETETQAEAQTEAQAPAEVFTDAQTEAPKLAENKETINIFMILSALMILAAAVFAIVIKLMFFGNNYNKNIRNIIRHFANKRCCRSCVSYLECAEITAEKKKLNKENVLRAFEIYEGIAFGGKDADKEDFIFVKNAMFKK